jgi:hypothetical protein
MVKGTLMAVKGGMSGLGRRKGKEGERSARFTRRRGKIEGRMVNGLEKGQLHVPFRQRVR